MMKMNLKNYEKLMDKRVTFHSLMVFLNLVMLLLQIRLNYIPIQWNESSN